MNVIDKTLREGQSLWYDNIERAKLLDGSIARMIHLGIIRGITSNPSIFEKAIATSKTYDDTLKPMAWAGMDSESIFWQLAIEDIQNAAQLFLPLYHETDGKDGFVSLEVNPLLANDSTGTIEEALRLWQSVNMPNLMIKIPATREGIPAIRKCIAEGLNVNVTLIFSRVRYAQVMQAYIEGLEDRIQLGKPINHVASVASFFVSRIDTKIDKSLRQKYDRGEISSFDLKAFEGKAAIANARLAYRQFEEVFTGDRYKKIQEKDGRVQRPLWASTSTKNPDYRDVIYIEELIAPNTVNTVPPATLEAFQDHGTAEVRIYKDLKEAEELFVRLDLLGISIDSVNEELEVEGVKAFADAYTGLLATVEKTRITTAAELASLQQPVKETIAKLGIAGFNWRLHQKDPSLWTDDPSGQDEIKVRMNWLETPFESYKNPPGYDGIGQQLLVDGFTHAVLLGMGGSSLAPEVMSKILWDEDAHGQKGLKLSILDSTDPLQVKAVTDNTPAERTLYIVASKSGSTGEINAFFDYFWQRTVMLAPLNPGSHFIAVTDPGTKLDALAREKKFRAVINADPKVGGRNSALTAFGLLPAAVMGIDLKKITTNAVNMAQLCLPKHSINANPGIVLGAIIGTAALSGKNKVSLITEGKWQAFGDWLEQLIAESSGKNGKGILPVTGEPEMAVDNYADDRIFVYFERDRSRAQFAMELKNAGHPVVTLHINQDDDLAAQFYLWQVAVATACSIIGVNSFDQPDVQDAKSRTIAGLESYRKTGNLPEYKPLIRVGKANILGDFKIDVSKNLKLLEIIENVIASHMEKIDYLAINAFLPRNAENEESLKRLRKKVGERFHLATTLGFGPRYLHSTGQLHKGGPDTGFFIMITATRGLDLEIPGQGVSFEVMQRAQAIGDMQALQAKGRKVLWIDLDEPDPSLLLKN